MEGKVDKNNLSLACMTERLSSTTVILGIQPTAKSYVCLLQSKPLCIQWSYFHERCIGLQSPVCSLYFEMIHRYLID